MSNLTRYTNDGIEVYIDTNTGESFCSVLGYARMAGLSRSTACLELMVKHISKL